MNNRVFEFMKITKNQIKNGCIVITSIVCLCTFIAVIFEFFLW